MAPTELSPQQTRVLAALRDRNPDAAIALHATSRGVLVEVRRGPRLALACIEPGGRVLHDRVVTRGRPPAARHGQPSVRARP